MIAAAAIALLLLGVVAAVRGDENDSPALALAGSVAAIIGLVILIALLAAS